MVPEAKIKRSSFWRQIFGIGRKKGIK